MGAVRITDTVCEISRERCVECGWCVPACSQSAISVSSPIDRVSSYLDAGRPTLAVLDPEAGGIFPGVDVGQLESALRRAGFSGVEDSSIGSAMVRRAYLSYLNSSPAGPVIRSTCPAIVNYVEKYRPELIPFLAPIVGPMIAHGRLINALRSEKATVIYIGACAAAKTEIIERGSYIDEMMTIVELLELFETRGIDPTAEPVGQASETLNAGTVDIEADNLIRAAVAPGDVLIARTIDEASTILAASSLFEPGGFRLLDLLGCDSCSQGPVRPAGPGPTQGRHRLPAIRLENYADDRSADLVSTLCLDLSRTFAARRVTEDRIADERVRENLFEAGLGEPAWRLNCSICGYDTCEEHAGAVLRGFSDWTACFPAEKRRLSETAVPQAAPVARDDLTGLPTRLQLLHQLRSVIELSQKGSSIPCLILTEIGSLAKINDDDGRQAADMVLQLIAQIIEDAIGAGGTVVRYGGDSFAAIIPESSKTESEDIARTIADRIKSAEFWTGAKTHAGVDVVTAAIEVNPTTGRGVDALRELETSLIEAKADESAKRLPRPQG